jgi:hypothetical protein
MSYKFQKLTQNARFKYSRTSIIRTNLEQTHAQISESPNYRSDTEKYVQGSYKMEFTCLLGNTTLFLNVIFKHLLHWYTTQVLITVYTATIYVHFTDTIAFGSLMSLKDIYIYIYIYIYILKCWLHVSALRGHLQATNVINMEVHCTVRLPISLLKGHNYYY